MNATRKVKLEDISANLACNLCNGYMIDATTTIECLHSFCKSCIVKHLENSEYCPVCDVQLHSTKPLSGIRSDQMLQEIIYKLVPGIFTREMERRRKFYDEHPSSIPTSQLDSGQIFIQPYITSGDKINISMECSSNDKTVQEGSRRYLQTPAGVSVNILRQWVQGKFELPKDTEIEVMYGGRVLPHEFLLMDIAYKYSWTESMTKPLQLIYRVKNTSMLKTTSTSVLKTTASKRKSRSLTDSEVLKSSNFNSLSPDPTKKSPLKLNGKVRGRNKQFAIINGFEPTQMDKMEIKKKKMTNAAINNFRDIESQCNDSNGNEVRLQISESGVISAKSVISGEEKIIKTQLVDHVENLSTEKSNGENSAVMTAQQEPDGSYKSQINGGNLNAKINFNYVKLNIPAVNGLINSTSSGMSGKSASNKKSAAKLSSLSKSVLPDKKLVTDKTASNQGTTFDKKQANMQKAIQDLQRHHLNACAENVTKAQLTEKQMKSNKILSNAEKSQIMPSSSTHSNPLQIPLPFPLSALASSGMTVDLIPSSELKPFSNGFKGKELQDASPPPAKKLKHQTTILNGQIRFTSPRQILPSTKATCTSISSVETSPTKPRKFFKSRHSLDGESPHKHEQLKTPSNSNVSPVSASKQNGVIFSNGFSGSTNGDLKLINSTSCNKSNTMTTPSRMSTPTTTAVQSTSMYSPSALSQLIQYWNWNALQFSSPMVGLPQSNFLPLGTNDFASMSGLNPRLSNDSIASLIPNSTYPMICSNFFANQNVMPSVINGINHENENSLTPKIEATDLSLSPRSKQRDSRNGASLDLSTKKTTISVNGDQSSLTSNKNKVIKKMKKKSEVKEKVSHPQLIQSSCINDSNEITEIVNTSSSDPKYPTVVGNGNSDSGVDSLSTTSENCDKETEMELHDQNVSNEVNEYNTNPRDEPENTNSDTPVDMNCEPFPDKELTLENRQFSPGNSNDSTDLVINEDCDAESSPVSEINSAEPVSECLKNHEKTVESIGTTNGIQEIVPIIHEKSSPDATNLITKFPICNNNNDPPADSSINIPQTKLTASESTTGG